MASVNKQILVGNVGRDPEMRYSAGGQPMTQFSLATSRSWKKDGEWVEETDWHNIVIWGDKAERAAEQVRKGAQVYVEGRTTNRSWPDKETGEKKYRTEVIADVCYLLGRRESSDGAYGGAQGNRESASMPGDFVGAPAAAKAPARQQSDDLDDLPF